MDIIELQVDKLKPYEKNAKTHPDEQVQLIANSIKEFGFRTPILVDDDFVIIQGHGRRLASLSLGLKTVPCVIADNLSKEQVKMLRLADNKVAESEWDVPLLDMELLELNDFFEIEDFGFELEVEVVGETDADAVPEVEENPVIKLGDLVEMGGHRLLCGDSTNADDMNMLMGENMADQFVTDPPYNVDYTGKTKDAMKIENDSMENDVFRGFLVDAFQCANDVMKQGATYYIWHADSEGYNFRGACFDIGWKVRQCLIWKKQTMVMGRQDYHWKHEPCLYGWKDGAGHLWATDRKQTTILEFDRQMVNDLHPTMKPVDLIEYNILNNTKGQDIVLDSFLGSGTAVIACENTGRRCFGLELDPKYAQVIIQRYCDYTGNDTITINGEEVSWSEYKERAEHSREKVS